MFEFILVYILCVTKFAYCQSCCGGLWTRPIHNTKKWSEKEREREREITIVLKSRR